LWRELVGHARYLAWWALLVVPIALLVGSSVAFFLWALDLATATRETNPALLWALPVAGAAIGVWYQRWGGGANEGSALIMDEIHTPHMGVPTRMAPMVLVGTLVTHLFGGSAGREGTALQMGGALASTVDRWGYTRLRGAGALRTQERRVLVQCGMAAGFGAVFGTPITGAIFALEVLAIGRLSYAALIPCLIAALVGDWATSAWGITHTAYPVLTLAGLGIARVDPWLLTQVGLVGVAFGLASRLFATTTHRLTALFNARVAAPWLRPAIGGVAVIALTALVGSTDYLGLGVTSTNPEAVTILSAFRPDGVLPWSWALKLLFTAVTLASGFKGGEVTPLFFIGATLGAAIAHMLQLPVPLFAALGFVAVFAGATNTPLACAIMGIELFGGDAAAYFITATVIAYLFSGHAGVYSAQRLGTPKGDLGVTDDASANAVP